MRWPICLNPIPVLHSIPNFFLVIFLASSNFFALVAFIFFISPTFPILQLTCCKLRRTQLLSFGGLFFRRFLCPILRVILSSFSDLLLNSFLGRTTKFFPLALALDSFGFLKAVTIWISQFLFFLSISFPLNNTHIS